MGLAPLPGDNNISPPRPEPSLLSVPTSSDATTLVGSRANSTNLGSDLSSPENHTDIAAITPNNNATIQDAWNRAQTLMKRKCNSEQQELIDKSNTADDVLLRLNELGSRQTSRLSLRCLQKITPFIEALKLYDSAMKTFCNCGVGELAIIWGSVSLVLQIAGRTTSCFTRFVEIVSVLGENLPRMNDYATIFRNHERMQHVLSLIYKDLLEFCLFSVTFFNKKAISILWRVLWSDYERKITDIFASINRHKNLADTEAAAVSIGEAAFERQEAAKHRQYLKVREVINWLAPTDVDNDFDIIERLRLPGTGEWIIRTEDIQGWMNGTSNVLWIYGIPGCGKTMLFSSLLTKLQTRQDGTGAPRTTLFFFCQGTITAKSTLIALMQSLVAQLLSKHLDHVDLAFDFMMRSGQSRATSLRGLHDLFKSMISASRHDNQFEILVDAWDEFTDHEESAILDEIVALTNEKDASVRVLITSRNEQSIRHTLQPYSKLSITADKTQHDIETYISSSLDRPPLASLIDPTFRSKITTELTEKASGQFIWVHLMLHNLRKATYLWELNEILNDLPLGLDKAYGRVFQKLLAEPRRRQEAAYLLLQWLSCAERPLTMAELGAALAIREGDTGIDPMSKVIDLNRFLDEVCGSLIQIAKTDSICSSAVVRFVHVTVKDFLLAPQHLWGSDRPDVVRFRVDTTISHAKLASTCLTQLSFGGLGKPRTISNNGDIQRQYPLLDYSSRYWAAHLEQSGNPSTELLRQTLGFVESDNMLTYLETSAQEKTSVHNLTLLQSRLNSWVSKLSAQDPRVKRLVNCFRRQLERTMEEREREFGPSHPRTLESVHQLAMLSHFDGSWVDAETLFQRCVDNRKKEFGVENPVTLESIFHLATVKRRLGRPLESLELHKLALNGRRRIFGDNDATTLQSEDELASSLKEHKLFQEAEATSRMTLSKKNRLYGNNDLRTAYTANILASILKDLGVALRKEKSEILAVEALQECERLSVSCLEVRENHLGPDHPEVCTVTNMLGIVTRHLGRLEESEKWHHRTLLARQRAFGPDNPNTQRSMRNLLNTFSDQFKTVEADQMRKRLQASLQTNPILLRRNSWTLFADQAMNDP